MVEFKDRTLNKYYEALRASQIQASSIQNDLKDFTAMLSAVSELEEYVKYADNNCISGVLDVMHKALYKEIGEGNFSVGEMFVVNGYSSGVLRGLDDAKRLLKEVCKHIEFKYKKEQSLRYSIDRILSEN